MAILHNVPPPAKGNAGGVGKPGANNYQRFIPREEVGEAARWNLGSFGGVEAAGPEAAVPPAAPPPDEAAWLARLAQARQQALQEGYQSGYRDGLAALEGFKQSFAAQATAQIGALLDAFDEQTRALDAELAQVAVRTALQLGRQVLRHELAVRPELVAAVATDAVNAVLLSARQMVVRVHPADLPLVEEGAGDTLRGRHARLVSDASVARGGVKLESDVGLIDAQIGTRWAQAAAQLGGRGAELRFETSDAAPAAGLA